MKKAKILRETFGREAIVRIIGAHNAIGAKLAARHGFEGIWASGLEISTAHAVPDANILTMSECLQAVCGMNEATSLPVVCDCDTGYGNSSNVQYLVKKYESAGIAGIVIEDKVFPKVNSFVPGRQDLAPLEEFMGKIEAAKDAQLSDDFMVFARVEALIAGWGMEEALRRAYAYVESGADGIVIHSKMKTPSEIYEFAARWKSKSPLVAIPTTYPEVTSQELASNGFKMVIYANQGLRASIRAMNDVFASIAREHSSASVEPKIAPMSEVFDLQDMRALKESERKYSRLTSVQGVILSAADHRLQPGLSEALEDAPLCMVDIGGKPLVSRQVETLRSCGVNDVRIVGGFLAEKIQADGVDIVNNAHYGVTGIAYSFLMARQDPASPCLLVYGDVVHDRRLVERLLKSPYPVTIVIDRSYRPEPGRGKTPDLVFAEDGVAPPGGRKVELSAFKNVLRIGRGLDPSAANYEFAGIALFKDGGFARLREAWDTARYEFAGRPFYTAPSVEKADMNDLLQFLVDRGTPVQGLEVEHGWSEIHSSEDLERVRKHFSTSILRA